MKAKKKHRSNRVASDDGLGKCSIHNMPFNIPTDCRRCKGEGVLEDDQEFGLSPPFVPCWECHGSGVGRDDCEMCLIEDEDDDA